MATIGKNQVFEIKNGDGTSFHNLVLRKSAVESIVMSLGDKISGDVYYKDNTLSVTMHEYITYNGVNYMLINPPTIVKEGVVSDNSELKGMTKYSFVFYHPMCQLSNFPFTDVAVTSDETRYLSESKVFSWIGKPADFIAKMNKNLVGTVWIVELSSRFPQDKLNEISDVIPFDNATIADACKVFYDTWGVPYVVDKVASTETSYAAGKRFKLVMGLPSNEIYANATAQQQNTPFVFQMGHGVGLKNNSRTPRNNKIITRISGYGSENNIPYGYPQVRWYGTAGQAFTYGDHAGVYNDVTIEGVHFDKIISYPIYKGILDGEYVELIKHPFTRTHLMPSVYRTTLFNKISFYDAAGEANTDYDPDITLVDYYDAVYSAQYPYPNTINLQAPSYESHEFEDEKPELGEAHIISATPLNNDLTPASSWDDSLDDEGNYKQSYFQMVLPQLSFDLYACASITEEMQINMRSGACLGCTFTVQVDWDDYKRNFYDEDGNFAPNGSQRDLTKYPKSDQGSIALVLQKDNSTFGTLMPNMYQYPKGETSSGAGDGDTFVILGISLPESYIFSAEWRLDADMKSYMLENNVHYFDYPLKFDEDFLFHNENILSQIRPNTIVRFNYAGQTQALFVKQITVKYGDQPLPQYDITLTDNVEVVLNQIGQVAEDVEKLSTLIAILRQSYGKNVWNELAKKLSKTQDDTAAGYITMLKGLQIGASFIPDILGEGGVLRMNNDGKVELVVDTLYARMRAYFDSVVIREYRHESGNRIKSPAQGFNASRVEYIKVVSGTETIVDDASDADYFRCYWRVDDGEKKAENQFIIGDLAFCEHSDVVNGSLVTKRYWRVVTGRNAGNTTTADGEAWIDLSNAKDGSGNPVMTTITYEGQGGTTQTKSVLSFESGSGYPEAHDDICMLGCTTDTTRQGAIIEYVSGVDAPAYQIYQGLGADATNPYSLTNKNQISIGYNSATGKADMKVYGDAYIGARDRSTFIEYKQDDGTQQHAPVLNIKAKIQILPNGSTIDGESISDYIKDNQNNYDDTEVQQAISDLNDAVGNLQDQIDGSIETLYGDVDPSVPANDPYKDYTTDEKEKHLGDMYYNSTTGYAYRYDKSVEGEGEQQVTTYFWQIIRDTGITQAIAEAGRALGLADTKAKVFTTNAGTLPSPPYKVNDVWVNATYPADGSTYSNEILKCVTAREQGATANIADWAKASKYTDDSSLQNFISATYDPTIAGLTEQVDRKIESWFQSADPSTDWYDDTQTPVLDVRADHVGDMWYSESTHLLKRYDSETTGEGEQAVTTYSWTTIQDQKAIDAYDNAAHAQDTADGKRRVFTAQPIIDDAYDVGDLWVNATYPATGTKTYENDVLRCKTAKASGVAFDIAHWQKASKYTDDSAFNGYISAFLSGSGASGDSATAAAIQKAIAGALGSGTVVDGGLLLSSLIGMRKYKGSGSVTELSSYDTWGGISGQYNENDETVEGGAKGHGIAAWYGGDMVDKEMLSDDDIAIGWGVEKEDHTLNYRWARSLFRFDGSGYIADANIYWNKEGSMVIKNLQTIYGTQAGASIDINTLSSLSSIFNTETYASGQNNELLVKPTKAFSRLYLNRTGTPVTNYPSDGSINDYAVLNFAELKARFITKDWFNQFFKVHYKATAGGADTILSPNTMLPSGAVDISLESVVSFWTNYAISALGQGVDGSHAIGVLDDLSDVVITTPTAGQVLTYKLVGENDYRWVNDDAPETYVLPQATSGALGGIKIGYDGTTAKTYAVALNNDGQAYVAVPWTDTTYTNGTGLDLSNGTFSINSTYQTYISHGESAYNSLSDYVKTSSTEQTIESTIGTLAKGVIDFYRSSGNHYCMIGFSNKDDNGNKQTLGFIGFKSGTAGQIAYRDAAGNNYTIWHEGNDGASSGLNADLLDGQHGSYYAAASSLSNYLPLAGGTMTGLLNLATGLGISDATGNGLLVYHPTDWNGVSNTQWGVGAINCEGVIRSSSSVLKHYRHGDGTYDIIDSKGGQTIASNLTIGANNDDYLQIGTIKIVYDSNNTALKVIKSDGTAANFYATGGIAALGSTGSGGGGGQGDVTWALLADNTDTRQIASSHLTTALAGYVTSSGVTSVATGTGLTGGTITSTGTISINSTYQTYISHGESAYNSLSSYLPKSGGNMTGNIGYIGSMATYTMITFIDNTNDAWGNGIAIGGGGLTIIGGGESVREIAAQHASGGDENMCIGNDQSIDFYSNLQDGWSNRKEMSFSTDGNLYIGGSKVWTAANLTNNNQLTNGAGYITSSALSSYLPLSGGTMTGILTTPKIRINTLHSSSSKAGGIYYYDGSTDYLLIGQGTSNLWIGSNETNGTHHLGSTFISAGEGSLYCSRFVSGSRSNYEIIDASNIGSQSVSYATSAGKATNDGSGNTITSTYLKLSGGTLTGNIALPYGLYVKNNTYGLNCSNSDIINVNGIFTADLADDYTEGYCFKRTNGNYDSFRANDGVFYFGANNGSENVRIKPDRGTNNGSVEIYGTYHFGLLMGSSLVNRGIYSFKDSSWMLYFDASNTIMNYGNVGIGTSSPNVKLEVNKVIKIAGATNNTMSQGTSNPRLIFEEINSSGNRSQAVGIVYTDYDSYCAGKGLKVMDVDGNDPSVWFEVAGRVYSTEGAFFATSSGSVGIGTTSPSYKLHVIGAGYFQNGIITGTSNGVQIGCYNGTTHGDVIERAGNLWIQYYSGYNLAVGQVSATYKFNVAGDIYATGGVTCASDARMKDVVGNADLNVEQVANAPAVRFLWKKDHSLGMQVGTIAQYWQKVLPEAVTHKSDELGLQYGVAALVAAITTARKVVDHEKRITELEKECADWKQAYSFLERAYNELKLKIA